MIKPTIAVLAAVAALGISACGDDDEATTTSSAAATEEASVSLTSPQEGATEGDAVTAEVELENFELAADKVGMPPGENEGHLHFSIDGGKYDNSKYSGENGKTAEMLGVDGQYSPSTTPTITYEGLPAGEHTLEVYLANNDHTDTGISDETTFTVE